MMLILWFIVGFASGMLFGAVCGIAMVLRDREDQDKMSPEWLERTRQIEADKQKDRYAE